jgi:outer membrane protein
MRISFLKATLAVGLSMTPLPVLAATQAQLTEAEQLLAAKKPVAALRLLEAAHDPARASTQEYFLLGVAAKQSGKLATAEAYLVQARRMDPTAGRIRLELAEVAFGSGKFAAAKAELLAVRAMNPPPQVRQNIDGFIAQVEAAKADPSRAPKPKKAWSGYVSAGVMSDYNANGGPNTDTVFLYGLPFTLSAGAKETRDESWFLRAGVSHSATVSDRVTWETRANLALQDYLSADAYDTLDLSFATGPSLWLSERASLSVPLDYAVQSYTDQGGIYSQSIGLGPRLQFAVKRDLQVYWEASVSRKSYDGNSARDVTAWELNPSMSYQPSANDNISAGLRFGAEDAGQAIYSNRVSGGYIGYMHRFQGSGVTAGLTASYTNTQFEGIQAAYSIARHDIAKRLVASVSYALPQWQGAELAGSVSLQDNASTIDLNEYTRTQIALSLTKRF